MMKVVYKIIFLTIIFLNIFLIDATMSISYKLIGDWQEVTSQNEVYEKEGWTTYATKSPKLAEIEFLQNGSFSFAWKMDRLNSENKLYFENQLLEDSIEFKETNYYAVNNNDKLTWVFSMVDIEGGQVWIALPPQEQTGQNYTQDITISESTNCEDLENLTIQTIDLNGKRFLVQKCDNIKTLYVNAYNFSIEPFNEQYIIRNIILNNTSNVGVSKFIFRGEVVLESSNNCMIKHNTIFVPDGYALYVGNYSSNNQILENVIISNATHNDDPVVYFYKSDSNNVTNNTIDNLSDANVNYYMEESLGNFLTIYPGVFYANTRYYELNESCIFNEFNGPSSPSTPHQGSEIYYINLVGNSWKCG